MTINRDSTGKPIPSSRYRSGPPLIRKTGKVSLVTTPQFKATLQHQAALAQVSLTQYVEEIILAYWQTQGITLPETAGYLLRGWGQVSPPPLPWDEGPTKRGVSSTTDDSPTPGASNSANTSSTP